MQVKHLLLLVVLILLIPPGFYWLMSYEAPTAEPDPLRYEVVKTEPDTINVKIHDREPSVESNFYSTFTNKLEAVPTWLVQDANFQGCVTRAVETCAANTTQKEAQALQSDTLCDALPGDEAKTCKNQFHHTKAIKQKDISLCEPISDQFQRVACQNGVFTQKALETRNPAWCKKLVSFAGSSTGDLVSPEQQNCMNLIDLQKGAADSTFLNDSWEAGAIQETVFD